MALDKVEYYPRPTLARDSVVLSHSRGTDELIEHLPFRGVAALVILLRRNSSAIPKSSHSMRSPKTEPLTRFSRMGLSFTL
jgi:hypothetical protein